MWNLNDEKLALLFRETNVLTRHPYFCLVDISATFDSTNEISNISKCS